MEKDAKFDETFVDTHHDEHNSSGHDSDHADSIKKETKVGESGLPTSAIRDADILIEELERQVQESGDKKGMFHITFNNPKHFTWLLIVFASMGGLLSGLDQSLISGANLFLPKDLNLTTHQYVNDRHLPSKLCSDLPCSFYPAETPSSTPACP
jgi:hypothetical protein